MSQFIEMYHKTHNTQTLESVCAIISKGITPKYVDFSSVAVVNQACIQWDGQHLENIKYHNEEILFKKKNSSDRRCFIECNRYWYPWKMLCIQLSIK